jgi:oxygen-independent coproporphyrinogen-3 oxidase
VIERILCDFRVDLGAVGGGHGVRRGHLMGEPAHLAGLKRDGIVHIDGAVIALEKAYWPPARTVAAVSAPICNRRSSGTPLRSE